MWEHIDLREIRAFLTLCEELHFGRSAERLGISQSRVTQLIGQVETKLGRRLFERTSRRVTITPGGERLCRQLAPALGELERTLRDSDRTAPTVTGVLRLGVVIPTSGGRLLPAITERFHREHPGCRCVIVDVPMRDCLTTLRSGEVEMLAIRLPLRQPDITVGPILTHDHRALAVANDHPLAGRTSITLEDVADYPIADLGHVLPPELIVDFLPTHTPSGRPIPRVAMAEAEVLGAMIAVARGELVHLTITALSEHINHPGITLVPVDGMPISNAGLVWLTRRESPAIRAFAQIARAMIDQTATTPSGSGTSRR